MNTTASSPSRTTITTTVGFLCLGLTWWIVSMTDAGWFERLYPAGVSILTLSLILTVIAILAFIEQQTLDAVIFFGGAGLLGSVHSYLTMAASASSGAEPAHYGGWLFIVWAVYFFYLWLAALKADPVRMLFLLGVWLGLLAGALADWGLGHILTVIGGYIGLATGILAYIVSASAITGHRLGATAS